MKKSLNFIISLPLLFVIILLASQPTPVSAGVNWYAAAGSVGLANCTIGNECSLWDAVALAGNGDTIYLRYGPYVAQDITDDEVLYIDKSLTIIGGCNADYSLCELGYQATSSIFDGDPHHNPVWPSTRVVTIQGDSEFQPTVVLRNLHIVRGDALGIVNETDDFRCENPTVDGCGGGIYANQVASLTIENCMFYDNYAVREPPSPAIGFSGYGGAIYTYDVSAIHINYNEFKSNSANNIGGGFGGAIALIEDHPSNIEPIEIIGNTFINNNCSNSDSSNLGHGCAIYSFNTYVQMIANNLFTQNNTPIIRPELKGSVLYLHDGGGLDLIGNTFTKNYGSSLIEEWNHDTAPNDHIERNKFWDNDANTLVNYTGIYYVIITNNFFGHNPSTRGGDEPRGAGQVAINLVGEYDLITDPLARVNFNTFAALDIGLMSDNIVRAGVKFNIFAHIDGTALIGGSRTYAENNLYWDNAFNGLTGTNPVYANPYLKDVDSGDFHLKYFSGAKDKSAYDVFFPTDDIDGQLRPFGTSSTPYDLGADEFRFDVFLSPIFN